MDKIDTQGLSGPSTPGCKDNIYPHDENGNPILPKMVINPRRLHTSEMVKELKFLSMKYWMKENIRKEQAGAYDDVKPLPPSYFDTEHFQHLVGEEEPPYEEWK